MKSARPICFAAFTLLAIPACQHTVTAAIESPAPSGSISIDTASLSPSRAAWVAHSDYVAVNIPFEPINILKNEIEEREGVTLKSRGEAHITVVTPQELTTLRTRMSLEQINGAVEKMNLQATPIELQCIGRGQLKATGKKIATYFIVVLAPGLSLIRDRLRQQFVAAGGEKQGFSSEEFYPHITVGFTDRDLYSADGVIKDGKTCIDQLKRPE